VRFFKIVHEQILIQKNFCSPTYQRIWNLEPRRPCLYGYDKVWTIEFLGSFSSLVAGSLYRRFDSEWNGFSFDYFAASYSETRINMNAETKKLRTHFEFYYTKEDLYLCSIVLDNTGRKCELKI